MNCEEAQILLHALADEELDPGSALRVQEHLEICPACAREYEAQQHLRSAMTPELYTGAPAALRQRLASTIREAEAVSQRRGGVPWRGIALAASVALAISLAWIVLRATGGPAPEELLAQDVLASHVRAMMADHLVDIASTDQHTVKPWFNGKLDFAPPVVDPAAEGYPLLGGRLDYLDERPVAAMVYGRRLHRIDLFCWPDGGPDEPITVRAQRGYHLIRWRGAGLIWWAVSDVAEADLLQFASLIQQGASATTRPTSAPTSPAAQH